MNTLSMNTLEWTLNGTPREDVVPPNMLLVDLLRGPLSLTGTHVGCDTAQCGACTVWVDERPVRSCSVLALQAQGCRVVTIEGLPALAQAPTSAGLHPLQEAFIECHGLQCGFCTPGILMAAASLLHRCADPTEDQVVQALEGNLCRCTGYVNVVKAVQSAARAMRESQSLPGAEAAAASSSGAIR